MGPFAPDGLRAGPWMRGVFMVNRVLMQTAEPDFRGQEHLPDDGPVLVAPNHVSLADPFVVGRYLHGARRLPRYLAKEELFGQPLVGTVLQRSGQVPVARGGPDAAQSLRAAASALRDGQCVVVYPEGTVTTDPEMWPMRGRTGVARLALATGAPVVPLAQWGAQHLPGGYREQHVRPWRGVPVQVRALPALDLTSFSRAGREPDAAALAGATEAVMAALTAAVGRMRAQTPPQGRWDPRQGRRVPPTTGTRR